MCTVHIACQTTAQENSSTLSSFFSTHKSGEHHILWWDTADNIPFLHHHTHSIPAWCHAHGQELQKQLTQCLHTLGNTPLSPHGQTLQSELEAGDALSFWYISLLYEKHPKMLPGLFDACKTYAIERLLHAYAPHCTHIILHAHDPQLRLTLTTFCKNTGRTFTALTAKKPWYVRKKDHWPTLSKVFQTLQRASRYISWHTAWHTTWRKLFFALPHPCQALLRFAHWLYALRKLLSFFGHKNSKLSPQAQGHVSIATYFPHMDMAQAKQGIFRSAYFEHLHDLLHQALTKKNVHIHWLFIRVNSAQLPLKQSIQLQQHLHYTAQTKQELHSFHHVEEFLRFRDMGAALIRYLRLAWRSRRREKEIEQLFLWPSHATAQGSMPLWPYMQKHWRAGFQGWRCLERCLQRRAFMAYAQNLTQQKIPHHWSLFTWENCPWERMFTHAMHKALPQSPVFAMQHSSVRETDFRYFDHPRLFTLPPTSAAHAMLADIYCLNGPHAAKLLQDYIPQERMRVVEAVRYLYLANLTKLAPYTAATQPKLKHLFLMTSYFTDEVEAQLRTLAAWLHSTHYQEQLNVDIHIKAHPHTCVQTYLQKYNLHQYNIRIHTKPVAALWGTMQAWFAAQQACYLWFGNSTTISLEAAHRGIPFCVQAAEDDFSLCPLHGFKNLTYVKNAHELHQTLLNYEKGIHGPWQTEFFTLNVGLQGWKALLGIA